MFSVKRKQSSLLNFAISFFGLKYGTNIYQRVADVMDDTVLNVLKLAFLETCEIIFLLICVKRGCYC